LYAIYIFEDYNATEFLSLRDAHMHGRNSGAGQAFTISPKRSPPPPLTLKVDSGVGGQIETEMCFCNASWGVKGKARVKVKFDEDYLKCHIKCVVGSVSTANSYRKPYISKVE
jgi:hypothetical protein